MKELADAARKINKILHEAENEGVGYDATLAKLNDVKYVERQKKIISDDGDEIQKKYENYSRKWNHKDLN